MIEVTSHVRKSKMGINPRFVQAITRPDPHDDPGVGCWLHFNGLEDDALPITEEYDTMFNQLANALAFSIVAQRKDSE